MAIDFVVDYDPEKDQSLGMKIIAHIINQRLKAKKPCVIFIGGDSGEGKSFTALAIADELHRLRGLDYKDYVNSSVAYTPLDYSEKLDGLLYDKKLKKSPLLIIDEARLVVRGKDWHSFINQAIGDVNALSRRIKPLAMIVVSQFIRDIDSDIRYTLNFYVTVQRPNRGAPNVRFSRVWKDDRDIEKPRLRHVRIRGVVRFPNGRRKYIRPKFKFRKPREEVAEIYEAENFRRKSMILKRKMEELMKKITEDVGDEWAQVDSAVKFYTENPEQLELVTKRMRGKMKLKDEAQDMLGFTKTETAEFIRRLNDELVKKGIAEAPPPLSEVAESGDVEVSDGE